MRRFAAGLAVMALAAPAAAGGPGEWSAGLSLRPALGVHPVRVGGGAWIAAVELRAVVDPLYWTDGVADSDLLAEWWFADGFSLVAGWRASAIDLGDGHQLQHRLLVGPGAALPELPVPW